MVLSQKFVKYFSRHSGGAGGHARARIQANQMLLDARFREHDGEETTDFFCEFLRRDTRRLTCGS